jgi:hypothetical protein
VVLRRPGPGAVEVDFVWVLGGRIESFDAYEGEVVAFDLEGVRGVAENFDAARPVGFDPDGRVRLADVPQQRSDT